MISIEVEKSYMTTSHHPHEMGGPEIPIVDTSSP